MLVLVSNTALSSEVLSALTWLRANDAKRARTFNTEDGCVDVYRKVWRRRSDGTIIGLSYGAATYTWESDRESIVSYVERKRAQVPEEKQVENARRFEAAQASQVPAPTGRVTFAGTIVSAKEQAGEYGTSIKITIKVVTAGGGVWLAWGTCPAAIVDAARAYQPKTERGIAIDTDLFAKLRGAEVEITGTLKEGREAHFALMSRPRGTVKAWPAVERHVQAA